MKTWGTLVGGAGADKLTGGSGSDSFKFAALTDLGLGAMARDVIAYFKRGDQTAPVIPTPALPDVSTRPLRRAQDLVTRAGSRTVLLPGSLGILSHRNDGLCLAQRNRFVTGLGVVGTVAADRQQRFLRIDLPEQTGLIMARLQTNP